MNIADLEILEYTGDMGMICWPAGFEQVLEGKTMEEQLRHYMILDHYQSPLSYYLAGWSNLAATKSLVPLSDYSNWEKVILRDGKVVGFVRMGRTILPYHVVMEDSTSDNNGAGYKERTDYYYLVCVPQELDRKRVFTPPFGAPAPELTVPVIPYDGSRGEKPLPEEYAKRLAGKPLSVQMYYFAVHDKVHNRQQEWVDDWEKYGGFRISDLCRSRGGYLHFLDNLEALIVQDDVIVGVRIRLEDGAVGEPTADLYPYEDHRYGYQHRYSSTVYPAYLQLVFTNLPG